MKRRLAAIMAGILLISSLNVPVWAEDVASQEESVGTVSGIDGISNPRIVSDNSMNAGQKVTYDCIWLGEYPQAEVVPDKSKYTAIKAEYLKNGDIIEDVFLYCQLQSASYDSKNEITINGTRYKRMSMSDAIDTGSGDHEYYKWSDSTTYHYFRYEPIKWRVIEKGKDTAFLLADQGLDEQKYNETYTDITWKDCSLRNFLNTTFYDNAFNISEKEMIRQDKVENADNLYYGSDGGEDTYDKVFLLSEKEVYKTAEFEDSRESFTDNSSAVHGFVDNCNTCDEARRAYVTTYSKAMGSYFDCDFREEDRANLKGYAYWWLRSPDMCDSDGMSTCAVVIYNNGSAPTQYGRGVANTYTVRPALKINIASLTDEMYAGTVCSDGTVNETKKPGKGQNPINPEELIVPVEIDQEVSENAVVVANSFGNKASDVVLNIAKADGDTIATTTKLKKGKASVVTVTALDGTLTLAAGTKFTLPGVVPTDKNQTYVVTILDGTGKQVQAANGAKLKFNEKNAYKAAAKIAKGVVVTKTLKDIKNYTIQVSYIADGKNYNFVINVLNLGFDKKDKKILNATVVRDSVVVDLRGAAKLTDDENTFKGAIWQVNSDIMGGKSKTVVLEPGKPVPVGTSKKGYAAVVMLSGDGKSVKVVAVNNKDSKGKYVKGTVMLQATANNAKAVKTIVKIVDK